MTQYGYPARVFDLDAVTESIYESGNLVEEVYRALGGDALPFYAMLSGPHKAWLRSTVSRFLRDLEEQLREDGIYGGPNHDERLRPRDLVIEEGDRSSPAGRRALFRDAAP